jgi:hypothetical protein
MQQQQQLTALKKRRLANEDGVSNKISIGRWKNVILV